MSAPAHTPGPWTALRAKRYDNTGGVDYAIVTGGKILAEAFEIVDYADGGGYDSLPVAANARLIAAAPELYDICDKMARHGNDLPKAWREAIRAALARARGES